MSHSAPVRIVTACSVVTQAEIEQALGRYLGKPAEESSATGSTCDYTGMHGQATITIHRLSEQFNFEAEVQELKAAFPSSKLRDIAGFGTRAFFLDIAGAGTQLHVIRGERDYVMVSLLGFGEGSSISPVALRIARRILERL